MIKIILLFLFSLPTFAQYNNQLQYTSGMQIKDDGEVIYNKKKWDLRKKRKDHLVVMSNDKKIEEGVNIKKNKNKIEVKYKDLKAVNKEVEYVFQGARGEKHDIASLTNFDDGKIINFTTCVGKKCLSLTPAFCQELAKNVDLESAKQCLSFSKAMSAFKGNNLIISDLKEVHKTNLGHIDSKLNEAFNESSNLTSSNEFELERLVQIGSSTEDYFELLVNVLNACHKNFSPTK